MSKKSDNKYTSESNNSSTKLPPLTSHDSGKDNLVFKKPETSTSEDNRRIRNSLTSRLYEQSKKLDGKLTSRKDEYNQLSVRNQNKD